jgi:hypothetical protein
MPTPQPRPGEPHAAYLARCAAELEPTVPEPEKREAVCERRWAADPKRSKPDD